MGDKILSLTLFICYLANSPFESAEVIPLRIKGAPLTLAAEGLLYMFCTFELRWKGEKVDGFTTLVGC